MATAGGWELQRLREDSQGRNGTVLERRKAPEGSAIQRLSMKKGLPRGIGRAGLSQAGT